MYKQIFTTILCLLATILLTNIATTTYNTQKKDNLTYYQLYLQCDKKWGDQKIGTSSKTICDQGDLLTSVAMVVSGLPIWWADPGIMNQWLKQNGGFQNQKQFVWRSIQKLGVKYGGNSNDLKKVKSHLDSGHFIIANYKNESHWAVIVSIDDKQTTVVINDPVKNLTWDDLSSIRSYSWYQRTKANQLQNLIKQFDEKDDQTDAKSSISSGRFLKQHQK